MYTRDTAFVIRDRFFYSSHRGLKEREGEINLLLKLLAKLGVTKIVGLKSGQIEGGDVLVHTDKIYVGNGSRTNTHAINELLALEPGQKLILGENVMHLDTRFTILPRNFCLAYPKAFVDSDLGILKTKFKVIHVTKEELMELGTNVLVIDPDTICSPKHNTRINDQLKEVGFKIEEVDYTEPINLGGSFRCTTLPLVRE